MMAPSRWHEKEKTKEECLFGLEFEPNIFFYLHASECQHAKLTTTFG